MKRGLLVATAGIFVGLTAITSACGGSDEANDLGGEEPSTPTEAAETLEIVGKNIQFDKGKLEVAANTPFKVVFDHQDEGITHNFAIYRTGPPASDVITKTDFEVGPVTQELVVDGLDAGKYFYQCDVHPATMTGILEVK